MQNKYFNVVPFSDKILVNLNMLKEYFRVYFNKEYALQGFFSNSKWLKIPLTKYIAEFIFISVFEKDINF